MIELLDRLQVLTIPTINNILETLRKDKGGRTDFHVHTSSLVILVNKLLERHGRLEAADQANELLADVFERAFTHQLIPICQTLEYSGIGYEALPAIWDAIARKLVETKNNEA